MINWLTISTRPDLSPVHVLLLQFQSSPTKGYMGTLTHCIRYLIGTASRILTFIPASSNQLTSFVHFDNYNSDTKTIELDSSTKYLALKGIATQIGVPKT